MLSFTPFKKQRIINLSSAGASFLLLACVTFILNFEDTNQHSNSETLTLRSLEVALPPPPPPQEVQAPQQSTLKPSLDLNQISEGPVIEVATMNVVDVLENITLPAPVSENLDPLLNTDLTVDWSAFGLGDLDSPPQVITTRPVVFPPDLIRRNIHRVIVRLDVFIDVDGRATLIKIIENPYDELEKAIHSIVKTTRFSSPLKNGQPVRARFVWPLEIVE